jgi:hypothetical protein
MLQRHEHLALAELAQPHVIFHDRVAAGVGVLVAQPFEDAFGRVALLLGFRLVLLQDLIDGADQASSFGRRAGCCRR